MGMAAGGNKTQGSGVRQVQVLILSLGHSPISQFSPAKPWSQLQPYIVPLAVQVPPCRQGLFSQGSEGAAGGAGSAGSSQATGSAFPESGPQAPKALWFDPSLWSPLCNYPVGIHQPPLMCPCDKFTPSRNFPKPPMCCPTSDKVLSLTELEWFSHGFS